MPPSRPTEVHLTLRERLLFQLVRPTRYRLAVAGAGLAKLGMRVTSRFEQRLSAMVRAGERHAHDRDRAHAARLDGALVDALTHDASHVTMSSIDASGLRDELARITAARHTYRLNLAFHDCKDVLERDPTVKSALNIGAGIDLVFFALAKEHPTVRFTSIDFSKAVLARLPAAFDDVPDNWRGVSGYPLDVLAEPSIGRDLVLMTGVASVLTHDEYAAYLSRCKDARWIVLTDVWYPPMQGLPRLEPMRPEDVPEDQTLLVAGAEGGSYLHNHPAQLDAAGFEVVEAELCAGRTCELIRIIAKRKGLAT